MEEADLMEIPPPVNWNSKHKTLKRKEVIFPEVIDLDDYEDCPDLFLASGKSDTKGKGKQTVGDFSPHSSTGYLKNAAENDMNFSPHSTTGHLKSAVENDMKSSRRSYKGSHCSNEAYNDIIYVDDEYMGFSDNQMYEKQYSLLQSHFDELDIPPGIEVSVPWFTDDHVGTMNPFMGSASTHSTSHIQIDHGGDQPNKQVVSGKVQSSSSSYAGKSNRKWEVPKASGLHAASDCGKKPQAPLEKYMRSLKKRFLTAGFFSQKMKARLNSFDSSPTSLSSNSWKAASYSPISPPGYSPISSTLPGYALNSPTAYLLSTPSYSENVIHSSGPLSGTFPYPTSYASWLPDSMGIQNNLNAAGNFSKSSDSSCSKRVYENSEVFLKKFDIFKRFDTCEDSSDHFFSKNGAAFMRQPSKSWSKKIQDEWRILEKDLPDTIFVRVYESRMDLLRAAIIGAEGTPYHDCLFFFDMFFPDNYPIVPPQVKYHSGGLRINPNLYNCGKVCLSLLNTWSGSKNEKWIPGTSTTLQVLVSIQGLILNAKPYFNEPGYAPSSGTPNGENQSLHYNENTFIYSLKTMVYSIRNPPKPFEDLVAGHYFKRAHDILAACKAYKNETQVGSFVKSSSQRFRKESAANKKCNSPNFKKQLEVYLKTLVEAFAQVGVKDCDKFLS